ncbi:MAG TPA: efflux RND transporter permease subunit [Caulobacteraceae bacterium]|jgi:HAE1 family hydrophobic/amphiphilic exporter-1/multidrug efflux pump|nr:efflux RND transporter permease subunit [Caulobacteraceae bacterium]
MSRFFIDRPIFAWVIAILVMLGGIVGLLTLPVAQYPTIAPPAISITATYPGASADTLQSTVTQVIEQQMTGLDHLEYLSSTSDNSGAATITLTFAQGTNPDVAQVQVQNKLQLATPLLPQEVQQQGLVVAKASRNFLLVVGLYGDDRYTSGDLGDYLVSKLQDPLSRITGVGDTQIFGSQHAMRIWMDPFKLNSYGLTTNDVAAAITAQDAQVAAGQIGALPATAGQELNAAVTAQSRLQTAAQFQDILLKTNPDGSAVHLRDVARVELGQDNYNFIARFNGLPAAGMAIKLAPGANALATAEAVKRRVGELSSAFPPGVRVVFPNDSTPFVKLSIEEVVKTLFEAVILVFIVMYVFLQNWRATLIPTIAVPVVLLGTFGVLAILGYSINTLTMFAMVLAIGLLVDDAIVVVENVERLMTEEGLSPKEAARKSMDEITGALVGIVLVLTAVFLPMALFGGSTGVIYRQFSVTIVSAMGLSVLVALILTPALCATLLKPNDATKRGWFFNWFNRTYERGLERYEAGVRGVLGRWPVFAVIYGLIVVVLVVLFVRLPTGFLPDEDQGNLIGLIQLAPGATAGRTLAAEKQILDYYTQHEAKDTESVFTAAGFSPAGSGQNAGLAFVTLKNWKDRPGAANRANAIAVRATRAFAQIRDAHIFALTPPSVPELGLTSGFDVELEDRGGLGHAGLGAAESQFLGMAAQDRLLSAVRPNGLPDVPQLKVNVDQRRAQALGLSLADVNSTLTAAWGGTYVSDFIDQGRVKRIYIEGDAPFRAQPDDLYRWYVRGSTGALTPFSAFANTEWQFGPAQLQRYNGQPAIEIQGSPAPGQNSGAASKEVEKLMQRLPKGTGFEWTGLSYEEQLAGGKAVYLYALSILVVFLCLAALYESWSVPVAVLLVVPLGVVGAVLAVTLRGLANDVFFQVGLLTTMGLSAKNAILIVEFAEAASREGKNPLEAAIEAARLRLRPILMTSLAFMAGVFPLAVSTGAGSGGQNDIGTCVVGGMLTATVLAVFFVPLFFERVQRVFPHRPAVPKPPAEATT